MFDEAVDFTLIPPFDPYANTVNYLLASYLIPYVGLTGYAGTLPNLTAPASRGVRYGHAYYSFPKVILK